MTRYFKVVKNAKINVKNGILDKFAFGFKIISICFYNLYI